jgi:glycosyltransferase involved in cell wall biosynthesis
VKIALVSTDFLPNIGGITQHVVELAKALNADGTQVEVIAPLYSSRWLDFRKRPYAESCFGISVWRVPLVIDTSVKLITGQISSRISEVRFERELLRRLKEIQPDVVHWHALESRSNPLAKWPHSAKVWTNHTTIFIAAFKSGQRVRYRREAELADEITAPSEEICDLIAQLGISRDRIHFIPNGVDSQRFRPDIDASGWRERLQLRPIDRLILCPRRLERKNGVRFFVEAATLLLKEGTRDVLFAIAGDASGPRSESDENVVRELVSKSNFSSHFNLLGRVENQDLPGLYACSEIVVIPSLLEATSLSASEAMATGKPVVATNIGGLPFLIKDGQNGVLVPPCDAAELARAIRALLDSPDRRKIFGENGRARIEKELDWRMIAVKVKEIYHAAIQRHRNKPLTQRRATLRQRQSSCV